MRGYFKARRKGCEISTDVTQIEVNEIIEKIGQMRAYFNDVSKRVQN